MIQPSEKWISDEGIALINSLGGPPLSGGQSPASLKVTLENLAASSTPVYAICTAFRAAQVYT